MKILLPAIQEEQAENFIIEDKDIQVMVYGVGNKVKLSILSVKPQVDW